MVYRNQNYMTNKKIKQEVDKNQKGYEENASPSTPSTPDNSENPTSNNTDPEDSTSNNTDPNNTENPNNNE